MFLATWLAVIISSLILLIAAIVKVFYKAKIFGNGLKTIAAKHIANSNYSKKNYEQTTDHLLFWITILL
jgi:hypothetical protein